MKDQKLYILHILDSISRIERYTDGLSEDEFYKDFLIQDAVIRNIQVIGEASKKVDILIKEAHTDIPWRQIAAMRNKVIHEYFGVDLQAVWQVIIIDLATLKYQMTELQNKL